MDDDLRALERASSADPGDQGALGAYLQALERAGRPAPEALMDRRRYPARPLDLPQQRLRWSATLASGDGETTRLGWSPGPPRILEVPPHRALRIEARPRSAEELQALGALVRRERLQSISLDCSLLRTALSTPGALAPLGELEELRLQWGDEAKTTEVDHALAQVGRDLPGLRALHVSAAVGDGGIRAITLLERLSSLSVRDRRDLTAAGLAVLGELPILAAGHPGWR